MSDCSYEEGELAQAKSKLKGWTKQRNDEADANPPGIYSARLDFLNRKVRDWNTGVGIWKRRLAKCRSN